VQAHEGLPTTKEGASLSARCSEQLNVCLIMANQFAIVVFAGTKIRAELDPQDFAELDGGQSTPVPSAQVKPTRLGTCAITASVVGV